VCELGCGPGLPSLVVAKLQQQQHQQMHSLSSSSGLSPLSSNLSTRVIATDLDLVALEMVQKAAEEQGLTNIQTKCIDLTADNNHTIDKINADLYIMSDVFENSAVAKGAAKMTIQALRRGARVWSFAQSDRAQREIYRKELQRLLGVTNDYGTIEWQIFPLDGVGGSGRGVNSDDNDNDNDDDDIEQNQPPAPMMHDKLLLVGLDELNVSYG